MSWLSILGVALVFYWGWQMTRGREKGYLFDGPGGLAVLVLGLVAFGIGFLI